MEKTAESGFSLAFVAILVAVAGVVAATLMLSAGKEAHWEPIRETKERLEKINMALIAFQRRYKHLPCPARLDITSAHADYGVAPTSCSGGHEVGAVPFRTLQLPMDYGVDMWDMKITYIMSTDLSEEDDFSTSTGTLTVETAAETISNAAYALISHGKHSCGYHRNSTTRTVDVLSEGVEEENCNDDDQIINFTHNYQQTADYFDDIVIWAEVDRSAQLY